VGSTAILLPQSGRTFSRRRNATLIPYSGGGDQLAPAQPMFSSSV